MTAVKDAHGGAVDCGGMSSIATADVSRDRARASRAYLKAAVADGGGVRLSTSLLLLDSVAAIGFAAGLAGGVVTVHDGVAAMLPWALLAGGSAIGRGGCAMLAVRVGAGGAYRAKIRLRRRIIDAALHRSPGSDATTGTLMSAAVDEVDAIDGYVARFLPARKAAVIAGLEELEEALADLVGGHVRPESRRGSGGRSSPSPRSCHRAAGMRIGPERRP